MLNQMDPEVRRETEACAIRHSVPVENALALVAVESAGIPTVMLAGEPRAVIRYEGHYLRDRLAFDPKLLGLAESMGFAGDMGEVKNSASQTDRYILLGQAWRFLEEHGVSRDLAFECISIGLGQIMGAHWRRMGYPSAEAMLTAASTGGAKVQVEMIFKWLEIEGILDDLREGRFEVVARVWNGPKYRVNSYHTKLARFAAEFAGRSGQAGNPTLRQGSNGPMVVFLQRKLDGLGYLSGKTDGIFGARTRDAVLALQADQKLATDGVVGPATWAALEIASPRPVAPERATAKASDLREAGSKTISAADGTQVVGGAVAAGGLLEGLRGPLERLEDAQGVLGALGGVLEAVSGLLEAYWPVIAVAAGGFVVWRMWQVKRARVEDHRTGRNIAR